MPPISDSLLWSIAWALMGGVGLNIISRLVAHWFPPAESGLQDRQAFTGQIMARLKDLEAQQKEWETDKRDRTSLEAEVANLRAEVERLNEELHRVRTESRRKIAALEKQLTERTPC